MDFVPNSTILCDIVEQGTNSNCQIEKGIPKFSKGQIKMKAVWAHHRFSQKTNKQICFVCHEKQKANKTNLFVCSFFGRIFDATICFRFYLTFTEGTNCVKTFTAHSKTLILYHYMQFIVSHVHYGVQGQGCKQ